MRVSHLVRLAVALWLARWLALELAARAGQREPVGTVPDGPLPGRMPGPSV